jgi:CRISPR-associated endoribonuclease Cas6
LELALPYKRFEFHLIPLEPIILPAYKGSTLRGGFGNAFKKIVCALRNKECSECILKERCVYSYVFETPPPSDTKIMRKYTSAPHPFIIEPPLDRKRGFTMNNKIIFKLILIGKTLDYLPYFIYTFNELGNIGIGKKRGKYTLQKVKTGRKIVYDSKTKILKLFKPNTINARFKLKNNELNNSGSVTLNFLTPARIVYNGHLTFDLEFHVLIRSLIRRLSLLSYFHCDNDVSKFNFKEIIKKAKDIKVKERKLRWFDWERYSTKQDKRMKMGGFVGEITFEGNVKPFLSIIKAGEVFHAGKGTAFGLGKYEIKK